MAVTAIRINDKKPDSPIFLACSVVREYLCGVIDFLNKKPNLP
ncbi:MAG: hypothetical protein WCP32_01635 [Bacteroidota bacterium]